MKEADQIFQCTRCGYCCQGETTVSLNDDDQTRMCDALSLEREEVSARYWRVTGNTVQMKVIDGHCVFFKDGCTVHTGRPWRCAEWPLHPSILDDQANFITIAESCPGIKTEIGYEQFCEVLRALLKEQGRIRC